MDIPDLIAALSDPSVYPRPAERVEVIQTHISVVFLAGDRAFKIKKPLDLGFLDFTTLDKRRRACEAEVELNRRLAPRVYLGTVPITRTAAGGLRLGGEGEPLEWAVEMERLPEERSFDSLLARGELSGGALAAVGRRLAEFHAAAAGGAEIARWGRFEVVAGNARENFAQTAEFRGATISHRVWERLSRLTEAELAARRELIESRARRGVTRDTHGDLHLDHVYRFPERRPPDDLVIVDCIEFNSRFRYADPVSDVAFLLMDLRFRGRADLASELADAYFAAAGDAEGRSLVAHYTAYRAVVRGKVESFTLDEQEVPEGQRWEDLQRARAHFLLALGVLAPPVERPCLVLAAGLPAAGKSHLARRLVAEAGFTAIDSDAVRKELAGLDPEGSAAAAVDEGIYTPGWNERTYAVALERAERLLFEGRRVVVDASFWNESRRCDFLDTAGAWCVPARVLVCEAPDEVVRGRLARRRAGRSDAGHEVYRALAERWQEPGPETAARLTRLDTSGPPGATLGAAIEALVADGLA